METSHCRCPRAHQPVLPCENCVMHENCGHSQKYHPAGHELHFDSVPDDSGNDVRTPLVSTVSICHAIDLRQDNVRPKRSMQSGKRLKCLGAPQVTFLSASVGGMTVVTDQSLSSTGLARSCWMVSPLMHFVLPFMHTVPQHKPRFSLCRCHPEKTACLHSAEISYTESSLASEFRQIRCKNSNPNSQTPNQTSISKPFPKDFVVH